MLGIGVNEYHFAMPKGYLLQTQVEKVDDEIAQDFLNKALTIFKLFKDSVVLSHVVVIGDPPQSVLTMRHYIPWSRVKIEPYMLRNNEQTAFAGFWKDFVGINTRNFAAYRFHLADFRPYLGDRLTDYVESLEYLLVPDSGEGEISYKFRSRGVLILTSKTEEREGVYTQLKEAYEMRSAIVHGDVKQQTDLLRKNRWEDVIRPIRCFDREAIKFFHLADCLDNSNNRRLLLLKKLIFHAEMAWKTPQEFGHEPTSSARSDSGV